MRMKVSWQLRLRQQQFRQLFCGAPVTASSASFSSPAL